MNSAYTDGTIINTETEKSNDVNFFLSATRPGGTRMVTSQIARNATKDSQAIALPPINLQKPSLHFHSRPMENTKPAPLKTSRFPFLQQRQSSPSRSDQLPQLQTEPLQPHLQEEAQTQYSNWWGTRFKSVRNSINSFTPAPSHVGTLQGSMMNATDMITTDSGATVADVERAPLETGYRRWIIERHHKDRYPFS
jgi:hypothetical protein